MQITAAFVGLAALASLALGQNSTVSVTDLPACAQPCYASNLSNAGSCSATDVACLCNNQAFVAGVTSCVTTSCTDPTQLAAAAQDAAAICAQALAAVPSASGSASGSAVVSPSAPASASSVVSSAFSSASSTKSASASASGVVSSGVVSSKSAASSIAGPTSTFVPNSGADKLVAGAGVFGAAIAAFLAL